MHISSSVWAGARCCEFGFLAMETKKASCRTREKSNWKKTLTKLLKMPLEEQIILYV
jgi:hypothetical protein